MTVQLEERVQHGQGSPSRKQNVQRTPTRHGTITSERLGWATGWRLGCEGWGGARAGMARQPNNSKQLVDLFWLQEEGGEFPLASGWCLPVQPLSLETS